MSTIIAKYTQRYALRPSSRGYSRHREVLRRPVLLVGDYTLLASDAGVRRRTVLAPPTVWVGSDRDEQIGDLGTLAFYELALLTDALPGYLIGEHSVRFRRRPSHPCAKRAFTSLPR